MGGCVAYAVYPNAGYASSKVGAFIDFFAERFARRAYRFCIQRNKVRCASIARSRGARTRSVKVPGHTFHTALEGVVEEGIR